MINGGCKFFYKAMNLFKDGTTIDSASSNPDGAKYILDTNQYTQWESISSNDLTEESIVITLPSAKTINRLFMTDFNFKDFDVMYWNGSAWADFANVIGINGEAFTGVSSTAYSMASGYFEFDTVVTSEVRIRVRKTQVADAQKYLTNFLLTKEIGTFTGFPRIEPNSNRNEEKIKAMSGKFLVQKGFDTTQIKITFKTHPYQADIDIVTALYESEDPFLVYPCGGRTGTTYFKISTRSWAVDAIFNMQLVGKVADKFEKGVYTLGVSNSITLEEHI